MARSLYRTSKEKYYTNNFYCLFEVIWKFWVIIIRDFKWQVMRNGRKVWCWLSMSKIYFLSGVNLWSNIVFLQYTITIFIGVVCVRWNYIHVYNNWYMGNREFSENNVFFTSLIEKRLKNIKVICTVLFS